MKNIDFISRAVAKEKQIPLKDVNELLNYYWNTVKQEVYEFEKESIYMRNLGTLQIHYLLYRKQIKMIIEKIRKCEDPQKKENMRKHLRRMLTMRTQVTETNWKFYARKNNKKQKENTGGNQE